MEGGTSLSPPHISQIRLLRPHWLNTLLTARFFDDCACQQSMTLKSGSRERSQNFLDLSSSTIHCTLCRGDQFQLQIRRNTHQDAVRFEDICGLISVDRVQCYSNNQAKCIFLHARDPTASAPAKGPSTSVNMSGKCITCERRLMDADSTFCSLGCKLNHSEGLPCTVIQLKVSGGEEEDEDQVQGIMTWPVGSKRSRYHQTAAASTTHQLGHETEGMTVSTPAAGQGGKKKAKPSRSNFE